MTAARLSPAASMLRNSKLFAVPSPISLPPAEPSSDPTAFSDTATTPYPTRAAVETPLTSLHRGDWGLKRPLPVHTTTRSGTPVIRYQRGIDTPEHVADFESAADHVLTLRKYQELNLRVTLPIPKDKRHQQRRSVFHPDVDNTTLGELPALKVRTGGPLSWLHADAAARTERMPAHLKDAMQEIAKAKAEEAASRPPPPSVAQPGPPPRGGLPPEQPRRWRYSGPYLAGMNGMEFHAFLKKITPETRTAFRALVKGHLVAQRRQQARATAIDRGEADATDAPVVEVNDDDVTQHLRHIRSEPGKFGPLIAEFFDLADGPDPSTQMTDPWSYGRDTIAADPYKQSGPPRTHPSAGLSYLSSDMFATNDILVGPRDSRPAVPARLLKSIPTTHNRHIPFVGVAGFVVPQPTHTSLTDFNWKWLPRNDGPKVVVTPVAATMSQAGKLELQTKLQASWQLEDEVPYNVTERRAEATTVKRNISSQLPPIDRLAPRNQRSVRGRPPPEPSQDISEELGAMFRLASKNLMKSAT